MKYLIQFLIAVIMPLLSLGQNQQWFTTDGHLPSSTLTAITQDINKNIWIATSDGLARFDGAKWRHYHHQDSLSINSEMVTSLTPMPDGRILVGTNVGLQIYSPTDDRFHPIKLSQADGKEESMHVTASLMLSDSVALASTLGHGLFTIDLISMEGHEANPADTKNNFVTHMTRDSNGDIWVGVIRQGFGKVRITDNGPVIIIDNKFPETSISALLIDQNSDIYVATQHRLYVKKAGSNAYQEIENAQGLPIKSMMQLSDSTLILGTEGHGLKVLDIRYHITQDFKTAHGSTDFKNGSIYAMMRDIDDNLWLMFMKHGVLVLPSKSSAFGYIPIPSEEIAYNDAKKAITAIQSSPQGELWVAVERDGIYALGQNGKVIKHYTHNKEDMPDNIMRIYFAKNGRVWIGSSTRGLGWIDEHTGRFHALPKYSKLAVFDIKEDSKGDLWIATMGQGVFKVDADGNLLYESPSTDAAHYTPLSDLINNAWINSITLADNGKLYINTCYGLGCYDTEADSYINTFGTNRILAGEMVRCSLIDHKGKLWIGTLSGLYHANADGTDLTCLNVADGLPSNSIIDMVLTPENELWVTTNHGIFSIDTDSLQIKSYFAQDGLQGNEFLERCLALTPDSMIYAAGMNGISFVKPGEVDTLSNPVSVRITDVYLNDDAITGASLSGGKLILSRDKSGLPVYTVDAKDNSLGIELASDLLNSSDMTYKYRIDSGKWITMPIGMNRIFLNDLSEGKHTIAFMASSRGEQSEPQAISIIVRPKWYNTWWMRLIFLFIVAAIAALVAQNIRRHRMMQAKIKEQEDKDKLNEYKLQFLINIAHEIRTPMSLIISPLERLKSSVRDNADDLKLTNVIENNASRIIQLINEVLDVRKIECQKLELHRKCIDMVSFVGGISKIFETPAKNIVISKPDPEEPLLAEIDPMQFDKVIVNLLANAVKFTPEGGTIEVSLRAIDENPKLIEIAVKDNGKGMNPDEIDKIFERFYQANNQAKGTYVGSGVGLHLAKSLVEMHGGTIRAINNADGPGCCFIVHIPAASPAAAIEPEQSQESASLPQTIIKSSIDEGDDFLIHNYPTRPTVLVVEDDSSIRNFLGEELGKYFNVLTASNGREGYDLAVAKVPDIIVSDIAMPEMDGIAMVRKIRKNIEINHIPVLLLTGRTSENDLLEGLASGSDRFITKPFSMKVLLSHIHNVLNQREKLKVIYRGGQSEGINRTEEVAIKSPDERLMDRIIKVVNANLDNPEFTIEQMASDVGLSRVHLNRKLKNLTNQTTSVFVRNMRLKKAAELLRENPNFSIAEVARVVGFESLPYFSHSFKELFGVSPSDYAHQ